jgi:Leucine-rich repeat (LRR) protein
LPAEDQNRQSAAFGDIRFDDVSAAKKHRATRIVTFGEEINLSKMSAQLTPELSDLPPAWLALLFQHVACGPEGLASAAALSQTCKLLHSLSEGCAVTYNNVYVAAAISSPGHPVWQWLARRNGRVADLSLKLRVGQNGNQLFGWMQPFQILSSIPSLHLRVEWVGMIDDVDHPCMTQLLKQHGHLISHLTVGVVVGENMMKLKDFSEATAPCAPIDLTVYHFSDEVLDLSDLDAVAGSLRGLRCSNREDWTHGSLRGTSVLNSMSQLTALDLDCEEIQTEELWGLLAKLTSLQRMSLELKASGDPSPLSALTGLTYLHLLSSEREVNYQKPFSFSSLESLSTLQQLEVLYLGWSCAATSLQGLAGLSNLKQLDILSSFNDNELVSLEGISHGVVEFSIAFSTNLVSLAGIEDCTSMEKLTLEECGVSSLQPLRGLSSMKQLTVSHCCLTSLDGLDSMSLQSLDLDSCSSLTYLSGVKHISALKSLKMRGCGVTSLQPLSQLGEGLSELHVCVCCEVQEEVLELPHVLPTADVALRCSNVREVVLAGGVRRGGWPLNIDEALNEEG